MTPKAMPIIPHAVIPVKGPFFGTSSFFTGAASSFEGLRAGYNPVGKEAENIK